MVSEAKSHSALPRFGGGPKGERRPVEEEKDQSEVCWLISYSDFMMQLVCLFILLFSISTISEAKVKAFLAGWRARIGIGPSSSIDTPMHKREKPTSPPDKGSLVGVMAVDSKLPFAVTQTRWGLRLEFPEETAFAEGAAELPKPLGRILDQAAEFCRLYGAPVRVIGTASTSEVSLEQGGSVLAVARAEAAMAYLARKDAPVSLDPRLLTVVGRILDGETDNRIVLELTTR